MARAAPCGKKRLVVFQRYRRGIGEDSTLISLTLRWRQEIPAAPNLTRVQEVSFYPAVIESMDHGSSLYICSPRLVFFSQLRLPWPASVVWVAVEQTPSD